MSVDRCIAPSGRENYDHDWRLIEEHALMRPETAQEYVDRLARIDAIQRPVTMGYDRRPDRVVIGRKRRWYCTRCRIIEETEHEGEEW